MIMIKFWTPTNAENPSSYRLYMMRCGDSFSLNTDLDTWRIDPDHETSRGDNTEALAELILKLGIPVATPDASNRAIERAAGSTAESVWVLKGLHQLSDPHLTLGFGGQIYHANVEAVPGPYLSITSITLAPGQSISPAAASTSWRK
jgi:hypothetical protein